MKDELDEVQNMLTFWAVQEQYFNSMNAGSIELDGM
jgi:hypothetical protein